jgi:outer membrane cobalamin receptor
MSTPLRHARSFFGAAVITFVLLSRPAAAEPTTRQITVSASRIEQSVSDVPANVTIIDRDDIKLSAAQTVDDLLRRIPGFSLFRRQSSLAAHPTTQGVSLRGIGPSGVSRTLVLLDGIPMNDPFGGWIYWSKIPTELIERIEIVRGGGSSVWGNAAMGGVINIITLDPRADTVRLHAAGGNNATADMQAVLGRGDDDDGYLIDIAYFNTQGYRLLSDAQSGSIDRRADSQHGTGGLHVRHRIGPDTEARVVTRYFSEDRGNGTRLTGNKTESFFARAGLEHVTQGGDNVTLDAFTQTQRFDSDFSAQDADRNGERPALDQFDVPSLSIGAVAKWSRHVNDTHTVTAGTDYLWVDGKTNEDYRNLGAGFSRRRLSGGRQHLAGVYVQDLYAVGTRLDIALALRLDYWHSYDGRRKERDLDDGSLLVDDDFGVRDKWLVSPRAGVVFEASDTVSMRASAYRGFRAPTINELHRPFRVRNDITEADPTLDPETLWGAEGGLDLTFSRGRAGVTGYWNRVEDAIANVTIAPGPGTVDPCGFVPTGGVCRRRTNLGHTRILGAEVEGEWTLTERILIGASYLYSDAEIRSAPTDRSLDGNRVPQVPEHQASGWITLELPGDLTTSLELRYVGDQFEDDQNLRELDDYVTVNVSMLKPLTGGWQLFVGVENLFDKDFAAGETADGVITYGAPIYAHAGVRYER